MALVITYPQTGDPFGPGMQLEVNTDLIGPFVPGSWWQVDLTAPSGEVFIARMTVPDPTHTHPMTMLDLQALDYRPSVAIPESSTGMPGRLRVQLVEPDFTVVEDESVEIVMDRETGAVQELTAILQQKINAIPAGLTEEQAASLVITQAAVTAGFGFNPIDLVSGVAGAIASSAPLRWGALSGTYTLTGDGEMPDLDNTFQDRYGVYWLATIIPAGLGHRHGNSEEYPNRLVQWRTVHVVGGVEMVTEIVDATTHGELWAFRNKRPARVQYSILPGVTLQARWWQFP